MSIKFIAVSAFIFALSVTARAQFILKIKGAIYNEKGEAVSNASVFLYNTRDTANIQHTIPSEQGIFQFQNITDGTYYIVVSSVGFIKKKTLNFSISNGYIPFDTIKIKLARETITMNNITVTAKRPMIENRIDKTVINVDAFLNNASNSILEVLGNSPNIDVDINGNISLKGRSGVVVLIDGRQNYLNSTDLVNFLNSIPASQVDQIEIMTQPPAKYDAAGTAGVINIKMKKNKQIGFNVNVSVSYMQWFYPRTLNSAVLNYKINKWNIFGSMSYDYIQRYTKRKLSRYILSPADSSNTKYFQDENDISIAPDHSYLIGVDYTMNKNWTIGLVASNKSSGQKNEVTDNSSLNDLSKNGKIESTINGLNIISDPWINNSIGLSLRNISDKKKELTVDLNYDYFRFDAHQESSNYIYDSTGNLARDSLNPLIQKAILPSSIDIFSGKTDYSYSFKNSKIEAGIKSSFIQSKNNSTYYVMQNDTMKIDRNLSNYYDYKENINAAYVSYEQQIKKWQLQAGLRLEETNTYGKQNINTQTFTKSYIQLFPTVYLGYAPDQKNNYSLSYGRRIDRPYYLDLNPFLYLVDPYTYKKGNPDLLPYFTNYIELSYNFKGQLNISADYSSAAGIIDNVLYQNDSTKILLQSKANLNHQITNGLNINYNKQIAKWSTIILSYSLFNIHYKGKFNNIDINENVTTNLVNFTQQFHFAKGWSAELNIFYRSGFLLSALAVRGPRKVTGFAIGKDILGNKANLKLRVTDPLYIQNSYGSTDFNNIHTTTKFKEDSRRIGITFSYRFQSGIKNSAPKIYSPEERNRVNVN